MWLFGSENNVGRTRLRQPLWLKQREAGKVAGGGIRRGGPGHEHSWICIESWSTCQEQWATTGGFLGGRMCLCMLSCPVVSDSETLWTVGHQALLLMEFSRQENWSVLPCPPPRDLPNLGIQARSSMSPAFAGGFFATSTTWKALSSRVALPYSPTQYRRPQSFQHFSDSPFTDHWSALA